MEYLCDDVNGKGGDATRSVPRPEAPGPPSQARNEMPAVDRDRGAGHPARGIGRKKEEGAVEILRLAEAAHGDALHHGLPGLGLEEGGVDVGRDVARRERVDANAE